jgi:hypothetical protein
MAAVTDDVKGENGSQLFVEMTLSSIKYRQIYPLVPVL